MQELIEAQRCFEAGNWRQAEEWYRRVADADRQNGEAPYRLGLLALERKDAASAVQWLQKAAELGGRDPAVYNHLGVARAKLKQFDEAIASFQQAVEIAPGAADALYNWGNALSSLGRPDEAVEKFRAAAALKPDTPEIHYNLANALRDLGRLNEAVAAYRQVLRLKPEHLKAYNNLGNVLREQGKLAEAAETYRAALKIQPHYAQGRHNLGLTLLAQDRTAEAIAQFREVLRINPDLVAARTSLGKALAQQGQLDEALPILQAARSQGQDNVEAQLRLADKLRQAGRYDEAIACIQRVIEARADFAAAYNDLGLVWFSKQDYTQAVECYRQAIQIKPDFAEAHNNLAIALFLAGDDAAGLSAVDLALRIKPDFAVAHLNRAVAWLRLGQFERGWHEFEWRRLCESYRLPPLPAPLWDGGALPDRCLLLQSEQGLGDTIQLIRYAPLLKRRCGSVVLQCQPGLAPLLSRSPGVDRVIARGESLPEYHVQAPLMSLPEILGTTLATIPAETPYLFADEARVEAWRQRLAAYSGFKLGIAWQGNRKYVADNLRSIPLRHFAALARVPAVKLFSLQKGPGVEQIRAVADDCPVVDFGPEFDAQGGTFMDTAAVMRNLDLVITSDTAVAHLAGGLGVPVWVALGSACDWRWLDNREDSPWYPTMRLFRQARFGDWDELFGRIAVELRAVVSGDAARLRPAVMSPAASSSAKITEPVGRIGNPSSNAGRIANPSYHTPAALEDPSCVGNAVPIQAPIAPGELLDKISILEIKRARVVQQEKLPNIVRELAQLETVRKETIPGTAEVPALFDELKAVNETLWDIEDKIRECEARQDFGPQFIELARSVYRTNDRRTAIKRQINQRLGSALQEEKEYRRYDVGLTDASDTRQALDDASGYDRAAAMPVFYVNLQRRKDRNEQFFKTNVAVAGVEFHRWDAVDGVQLENEELLRSGIIEAPLRYYTPGAVGGALSQKAAWEYCISQGTAVTVCEDDAVFNRHFAGKAASVLCRLPQDWDIILWGWNFDSVLQVELIPGLKQSVMHFDPAKLAHRTKDFQEGAYDVLPLRMTTAFGTVCYSISPKGAGEFLRRCFPLKNESIPVRGLGRPLANFSLDTVMNKHYGSTKAFVSFPPLVWTENDKATSDISPKAIENG